MPSWVVAIDGPSASGKSTVAKHVARTLGFLYVDSGALYRAITWRALRESVDVRDPAAVAAFLKQVRFDFSVSEGAVVFTIDGLDPGVEIRLEDVNRTVSHVAATVEVRTAVGEWLRGMRDLGNLVVEGRDIGTAVFPAARWKFYLDASPEVRARRRHAELSSRGHESTATEVTESLQRRDRIDSSRKTDPLRVAEGAVVVDTTSMTIEEVSAFITRHVRAELA